jgi:CBS domain-containing protein
MDALDAAVSEAMTGSVRTVTPDRPVAEAADLLVGEGIGSVFVDGGDGVEGVVTKTDVVAGIRGASDPGGAPVGAVMSGPVVTVGADASLRTAVDRMADAGIKRLLVTDGDGPVGVLTTTDVIAELSPDLDAIVEMFAE